MAAGGTEAKELSSVSLSYLTSPEYQRYREKIEQFFCTPGHLMPDLDTVVDWDVTLLLPADPSSTHPYTLLFSCVLTCQHFGITLPPSADGYNPASIRCRGDGGHRSKSRDELTRVPQFFWMDINDKSVSEHYIFQKLGMLNEAARTIFTAAHFELTEKLADKCEPDSGRKWAPDTPASQRYCQQLARRLEQENGLNRNLGEKKQPPSPKGNKKNKGKKTKAKASQMCTETRTSKTNDSSKWRQN